MQSETYNWIEVDNCFVFMSNTFSPKAVPLISRTFSLYDMSSLFIMVLKTFTGSFSSNFFSFSKVHVVFSTFESLAVIFPEFRDSTEVDTVQNKEDLKKQYLKI